MDPNIWGSHAWLFLHTITLNYPDNPTKFDMDNYKKFFENLGEVIPCEVCKAHYKKNIKMYPIQLESKEALAKWLHHIHNLVNIKNDKPEYSYDQFIEKYTQICILQIRIKSIYLYVNSNINWNNLLFI